MVRPNMYDPALCEELKKALTELQASRVHPPAAAQPWEVNSLVPDPTAVSEPADVVAEIERIEAALRENGCVD